MSILTGKHLHIDCFSGIAGDMFLGASMDLGVPEALIRAGLALLPWGGYELRVGRAVRKGIEGCNVEVIVDDLRHLHEHEHDHEHEHVHGHGHRAWKEIRQGIEDSALSDGVKARALDIFGRVARAEGKVHGVPTDEVHFHEVGATDSIVDIVGAAICLAHLAPASVSCRTIPLGQGTVRCAHGVLPVPPPATVEILKGASVETGDAEMELCTPTGAAIVQSCHPAFGPLPRGSLLGVGYGAGDRELPDRPNQLRLLLLDPGDPDPAESRAILLEANVDDMSPEGTGYLMERLFEDGARDVWFTPIVMKKGRPALTISVLCAEADAQRASEMLFSETTTIGLRRHAVDRRTLSRELVLVTTPYGDVQIKVARDGERVLNVAPEFESCREAARRNGVPLKEVHAAAASAYRATPGAGR